jgi:hypothetical protein
MKSTPLFHLGYPKTASTWLQKNIFNDPNFGFSSPWEMPNAKSIEHFVLSNPYVFDPEQVYNDFQAGIEQAIASDTVPVISHEILVGDPLQKWDWSCQVANRIYQVFPQSRILILIREQRAMVLSLYRQHIKKGERMTLKRFLSLPAAWPGFRPGCQLEMLNYHHLIAYYQDLFGRDRILVWPFEQFKQDLVTSIQTFQTFAHAKGEGEVNTIQRGNARNVGYLGWTLVFRRYLNFFCETGFFGPGGPPKSWQFASTVTKGVDRIIPHAWHQPKERQMKQYIDAVLGDRYQESNRHTMALTGLDLAAFGYNVGA